MAVTLDELSVRLERVEREVNDLRRGRDEPPRHITEGPLSGLKIVNPVARLTAVQGIESLGEAMGGGEPHQIEREAIRRQMIDAGIDPSENIFSRGIIEMREE